MSRRLPCSNFWPEYNEKSTCRKSQSIELWHNEYIERCSDSHESCTLHSILLVYNIIGCQIPQMQCGDYPQNGVDLCREEAHRAHCGLEMIKVCSNVTCIVRFQQHYSLVQSTKNQRFLSLALAPVRTHFSPSQSLGACERVVALTRGLYGIPNVFTQ